MAEHDRTDLSSISLFDRLMDSHVDSKSPAKNSGFRSMMQDAGLLKRRMLRDLQNLLNNRAWCMPIPPAHSQVRESSILSYGVPDFCGMDLGDSYQRQDFLSQVRKAIATFEPRLKSISITVLREDDPYSRALQLRITAVLDVPTDEPNVLYISSVDSEATKIVVTEPRNVR